MPKRKQPERDLQGAVSKFLRVSLPHDTWYTSIPGGHGRMTTLAGYRIGCPDFLIVYEGSAFFIELKAPKGVVSEGQALCHVELLDAGAKVSVCRSIGDVERFLTGHFVPLRGRVAA